MLGAGQVYNNPVLDFAWIPRFVEPQPGLPWGAPFIYEDRRSIFYVNPTVATTNFIDWDNFGVLPSRQLVDLTTQIPSLVLRTSVATPQTVAPGGPAPGNQSAIQRYIAADTDLNAALSSSRSITYQGLVIGPTGSVPMPTPNAEPNGKGA